MCTTGVAFSKNATYVFKNRDLTKKTQMACPQIRLKKHKYIAFPGQTGGIWFGVNEYGIALTASDAHVSKGYPVQKDAGDKITGIYEEIIANSSTLKEAEKIMTGSFKEKIKVPDMLIITDSKNASVYEYTPEKQAVLRKSKGALLRANSFHVLQGSPGIKKDPSSHLRYEREKEMLRLKISLAQIKKVLKDHKNGPGENSICRHGKKKGQYTTQYSVIAEIRDKMINVYYIANRNPCKGKYMKMTIKRTILSGR